MKNPYNMNHLTFRSEVERLLLERGAKKINDPIFNCFMIETKYGEYIGHVGPSSKKYLTFFGRYINKEKRPKSYFVNIVNGKMNFKFDILQNPEEAAQMVVNGIFNAYNTKQ